MVGLTTANASGPYPCIHISIQNGSSYLGQGHVQGQGSIWTENQPKMT